VATPTPQRPRPEPDTIPTPHVGIDNILSWTDPTNPDHRHRVDAPATLLPDGQHIWQRTTTDNSWIYLDPTPATAFDQAWADHHITDATATHLFTTLTDQRAVTQTWLTHLLLNNPSPHLTDTWRILAATHL
jgi:hypothetical protein